MEPIQLIITFMPGTGQVQVEGPIQDKLFCYGLLENAKDAIRSLGTKEQPLIQPANGEVTLQNRLKNLGK